MVIGAPLSDLITFEATNIWGKKDSAEGFLYWILLEDAINDLKTTPWMTGCEPASFIVFRFC